PEGGARSTPAAAPPTAPPDLLATSCSSSTTSRLRESGCSNAGSASARSATRRRSARGTADSRRGWTRRAATTRASRTSPTSTGTAGCSRNWVITPSPGHGENAALEKRTTIGAGMGLSWQQGPLGRNPNGRLIAGTRMPERVLYLEPLRRRMSVRFAGSEIARSDDALILFEPARYPVAYFPIRDIEQGVLQPTDRETDHGDLGKTRWFDVVGGDGEIAKRGAWQHVDPPPQAEALRDTVAFAWR